jgi:predicted site-specific integrase-resolvase
MINKEVVAGYTRVSDQKFKTDGERRQDINRQIEKIKSHCKMMELGEPIFFIDDGLSAYKDDYNSRPNFVKMLNEVRANRIKHIIVEDISRWSRRIEDGLKTLSEVTEKCKVTSLAEGELGVTIPEQWFKTTIGLLMSEWSSKIQSYKVTSGMKKRLTNPKAICEFCGGVHLGRIPNKCKRVGQINRGEIKQL